MHGNTSRNNGGVNCNRLSTEDEYCNDLSMYDWDNLINDTYGLRFLALWKIYDKMLHDDEMEEAENVIFVPDGPVYENIGIDYSGTQPRRRLKTYWHMMKKEEKNNKARVTLRRYMALMANRKLRKEVFGF